jgi:hypothetical protein
MGGTVTSGRLTHGTSSLSVTILDVVEWAVRLVFMRSFGNWGGGRVGDFPAPPMRGRVIAKQITNERD